MATTAKLPMAEGNAAGMSCTQLILIGNWHRNDPQWNLRGTSCTCIGWLSGNCYGHHEMHSLIPLHDALFLLTS